MSTTIETNLLTKMQQLIMLNKSLLEIARLKADYIKKSDIEQFQNLQNNEQKHLTAVEKINAEREVLVAQLLPTIKNPTVSDCLQVISKANRAKLEKYRDQLTKILTELQNLNDLNQQLLKQSLQYINMSVQMLLPHEEAMNYGQPSEKKQQAGTKRLFQSEA